MYATLADIRIAHIVHHGNDISPSKPFVEAGNEMMKALGAKKFAKLIENCVAVRRADPDNYTVPYEVLAERVKAAMGAKV